MTLRVREPGLYSLVVDLGRPSYRSLGVPVGGAADRTALLLGNALLGNPPHAAALEISLAGPALQAEGDLACAVVGAPFELHCGQRLLRPGTTFTLRQGDVLRIGGTPSGMRAYLCVHGGLQTPYILGSRSALEPVQVGMELPCQPSVLPARGVQPAWRWNDQPRTLRILPGLQAEWFPPDLFASQSYTVTPASNRMGLRIQGEPLPLPRRELISEPVCPGAVQVTRDGQCIILGVDGQTIGGYPKIAQVISADLDKLGQLRPGERIAFQPVTLDVAETLYRQKQAELRHWQVRLQTAELFQGSNAVKAKA